VLASCFGTVPAIGARLARLTFEPDLMMTDGIASLVADVVPVSGEGSEAGARREGWLPFRAVFDLLWSGRRHVVMIASQIDRTATTTSPASAPTRSRRRSCSACAARPATR
jgi:acyl CoA:acetate/3-ketoacid CoA transferase beta subunit